MSRIVLAILGCLMFFSTQVLAQERTVTGKVTADDGSELPGVTISIQNTNNGTITDANGFYSIDANNNTVLVFSFIGFEAQNITVGNQTTINVVLSGNVSQLQEVVVTAMGISKEKRALGYATQGLKAEEISAAASTNLASALQGKVSGVEIAPSSGMPGASSKITIRGSRSFTGDNTPLYVVDGMPISSAADVNTNNSVTGTDFANRGVDIDPNDIESINILKGQAASALYGMRASNGVIIITTKSGKGMSKGKAQISLNSNLAFDKISVLPDFQTEYAQGTGGGYSPNASTSWGPKINDLSKNSTYGGDVANSYTDNGANLRPGQYYVPQRAAAGLDPWATPRAYNNAKDFFQTGTTWSNSINIRQGLEKGSYSLSLGNTSSDGIIPTTGMDRFNAKLSAEMNHSKNWTTGFSGNFVNSSISKQSSANDGVVATVYGAPASYDFAGIPSHVAGDPYTQNTFRGTSGFNGAYWALDNNKFTEKTQRFFGNAFTQFSSDLGKENQKLVLKYQLGTDSYTTNYSDVWGYGHANGRGQIEHYHYSVNEVNSLATATYNWKINSDFELDVLIGNELVNRTRKYDYSYGANFNFPGWNHMDNASTYNASEEFRKTRTVGTFGNVSLNYRDMLYLNVTGRNDVVSTMPRNNRSFFYPSVSLGWVFTEVELLRNDVLTYGKLRVSYAEVGQAGNYLDSYYSTPTYGGGFSSGTPIIYPIGSVVAYTPYSRVYDPNLRPQNTQSYELGTDLAFYNGLINLSYTFSRQNVKDQIFPVPLAGSTGSSELMTNGGSIHTNVHELTLNVAPFRRGEFKWDFGFNFSKIDNYVDELAEGVNSIFLGGFVEPQVRAGIGAKFPVIYGTSFLRNEAGQIVVDEDGMPQIGEEKVIGTVAPDFMLGFNTALEYKKVRLAAVFHWKSGGQMYSGTSGLLDFYGVSQRSANLRQEGTSFLFEKDAVKEVVDASGNITYAPNDIRIEAANAQTYFSNINNISESMIYDNSFIKLREISLGYPVLDTKNFKIDINLFARNLLLWSTFKGLDPEATQGNNNMAGAFERFSLPGTSSYGLGLNVKF